MVGFTRREFLREGVRLTEVGILATIGGVLKPPKEPTEQVAEVTKEKAEVVETTAKELDRTDFWKIIARDVMLPESNEVLGPMEPLEQMTLGGERYAVAYERSRDNKGLYLTKLVENHQGVEPIELNSLEGADWMSVHSVNIQTETGNPNNQVVCVITEQLVKGSDDLYDLQFWANLVEVGPDGQVLKRKKVVLPKNVTGISEGNSSGLTDEMSIDMAKDGIQADQIKMRPVDPKDVKVVEEAGTKSMAVTKARGWCDGNRLLVSHTGKTYDCTNILWDNQQQEIFTPMVYIDYPSYPGYSGAFAFESDGKLYSYTKQGLVRVMSGPTYDQPIPLENGGLEGLGLVMEIIATGKEFVVIGRSGDQVKVWTYNKGEKKFVSKFTFTDTRWIFRALTNIKLKGEQLVIPKSLGTEPGVVVFDLGKGEDGQYKGEYKRYGTPEMATMGLDEAGLTVIMPQHDKEGDDYISELWGLSPIKSGGYIPRASQFNDGETN